MRRVSLRVKFLLLVAGTVVGLASIILAAVGTLMGREIDRAIRSDVHATGSVLAQLLRERGTALESACLTFARQPVFKAYLGVADASSVSGPVAPDALTNADSVGEYLKELRFDAALITDRDGFSLGETDAARQVRADRSGEPGIAAALQGRDWSGVVARGGKLMLAVSVPVIIHNEVWGTFTAYSRIDSEVARELKQALGSDIAFVHHRQVMGASLPLPARLSAPRDQPHLVTIRGARYFAVYAPLPNAEADAAMGFVTLRSYDQAMALSHRFQTTLIGISVFALLLALAAGAGVSQGITRPLDGVVQAAQTLRAGAWPEPFAVRRADEIGLLQLVFNEMTAAVRSSQERLLGLIDIDPLTELDNHRRFQERLAQEAKRSAVSGEPLSLLLLDLDQFHAYNQRNGHAAGDEALRRVASIARECLSGQDIPARYGGDQFAVLLLQRGVETAEALAERIRGAVEAEWSGEEQGLTLSVGCAEYGIHTREAEGLTLAVELAVSQAKQLGQNRVCRFDSVPGADESADPYHLHRSLKDGSLATIQALAAAVDAKDPYTRGHSQRVAQYASDLARAVGLPPAEIDLIHTTGTLHDVGKIGVPDAILKKPSRLDDAERTVMETHPGLGEVIVRKVPQLAATLPGVRHHHERWDGRGYPDGLAGEAIPLLARILAVADTYDAMTSDRPYRKGMAAEVALEEIHRGAGTQFDPELSPAFVAMMQAQASPLARAA